MSEVTPEPAEPVDAPDAGGDDLGQPAWSGPSQEEWQQTQQLLGYVAQQLQPQQDGPRVDPYDDDFQSQLDRYLDQRLAPLASFQERQATEAAGAKARELMGEYASEDPFLLEDSAAKALSLANDYLPQTQQRFGYGPKAAQEALKLAHKDVRAWEDKVIEAHAARQQQHLTNLAGARREPAAAGVNGAATQMIHESGPGDERSLVTKYFGG